MGGRSGTQRVEYVRKRITATGERTPVPASFPNHYAKTSLTRLNFCFMLNGPDSIELSSAFGEEWFRHETNRERFHLD